MRTFFLLLFWTAVYSQNLFSQPTASETDKSVAIKTDSLLTGTWIYLEDKSSGSGHTFVDHVQKTKWILRSDGTYEKGAQQIRNAGQTNSGWSEATEKGTWRSKEGKIYLYMRDGQIILPEKRLLGTYYIEGTTMIFTDTHGKKLIWRRSDEK